SLTVVKTLWASTEDLRQPQGDAGQEGQDGDQYEHHHDERRGAEHDVVHAAVRAQALDHEQVQADGGSDQCAFHQDDDDDAQPYRVVAHTDHDGRNDGNGGDHHGKGLHEAAQHEIEDHQNHQHPD